MKPYGYGYMYDSEESKTICGEYKDLMVEGFVIQ